MAENEIGFRCVRCKKCPPDAPVMDPASFQEHFAIEHMNIPGFKCACGKKFATILIECIINCNAPNLDARLLAGCIALNEGIQLAQKEACEEFAKRQTPKLEEELRKKLCPDITKEIRRENSKNAAKENIAPLIVDVKPRKSCLKVKTKPLRPIQKPQIVSTYLQLKMKEREPPFLAQRTRSRLAPKGQAPAATSDLITSFTTEKMDHLIRAVNNGLTVMGKKAGCFHVVRPVPPAHKNVTDPPCIILLDSDSEEDKQETLHVSNDAQEAIVTISTRSLDGRVTFPK